MQTPPPQSKQCIPEYPSPHPTGIHHLRPTAHDHQRVHARGPMHHFTRTKPDQIRITAIQEAPSPKVYRKMEKKQRGSKSVSSGSLSLQSSTEPPSYLLPEPSQSNLRLRHTTTSFGRAPLFLRPSCTNIRSHTQARARTDIPTPHRMSFLTNNAESPRRNRSRPHLPL